MAIKYALLALLAEKPQTASALQQQFIALTEGTQTLNIGQVSQTLSRLERNNFIARAGTVRNPSGHQVEQYELTPAGQELLTEWLERPVIRAMTDRDELVTKIAIAATRPDWDLISLLDTQRSAVLSQLKELNRQNRKLPQQRWRPSTPPLTPTPRKDNNMTTSSPNPDTTPTEAYPLELRDITCVFGRQPHMVTALDHVSMHVQPGELVAIMGPSGSGKSTLLNVAGLLQRPTTGGVLIDGVSATTLNDKRAAALRQREKRRSYIQNRSKFKRAKNSSCARSTRTSCYGKQS